MIVKMCKPNFEPPIVAGIKIHTIRPPAKRPILPGMELSLRVWTGKAYRSPQREILRTVVTEVEGIRIHRDGVEFSPGTLRVFWCCESNRKRRPRLEQLARNDGFQSWEEMRAWFENEHGLAEPFEGSLISWKPPTA